LKEFYLVCYDISDERRLSRVAKIMEDYGTRVLYSIFECYITPKEFDKMKSAVEKEMDPLDDRVRYYKLCPTCRKPVIHLGYGKKAKPTNDDTMIL